MKTIKQKKILGAFLGTIVEYYDYSLYGFSASIIATKFFPVANELTNLKYVFEIYAISYIFKPLGAIIFSYIGDQYGRKYALNITILGIATPTVIIGLLPEYSSIGSLSIVILLLCRMLQGLFAGGEYDGAAIYVIEHLGEKNQAMASAITRATGVAGLLLGIGATNFFSSSIFPDWAWRIPFLLSLPLSLVALYFRKKLIETPVFNKMKSSTKDNNNIFNLIKFSINKIRADGFNKAIRRYLFTISMVLLLVGGFGVTYQVSIMFIKGYLPIVLPQTKLIMTSFSVLLVFCFGVFMPISGFFADKFGEVRVINIGVICTIISCILLIVSIKYQIVNLALFACLTLAASVSPFNALAHSLMVNCFPPRIRYRSVGIGHTFGSMLMSGSANYICLSVMEKFQFNLFPVIYVMIFTVVLYIVTRVFFSKINNKHLSEHQVEIKSMNYIEKEIDKIFINRKKTHYKAHTVK